jgi:hypothetical protein
VTTQQIHILMGDRRGTCEAEDPSDVTKSSEEVSSLGCLLDLSRDSNSSLSGLKQRVMARYGGTRL